MAYNVLLVDDSAIVRKVIKKTFSMTDIPVNNFYEAENGAVGLELLREHWVDVVFLDINMPVMNGMEFMTHLRADPLLKDTPVIIASTEGSHERREELAKTGVKAYLRKPISAEALVETVTLVFGDITHE